MSENIFQNIIVFPVVACKVTVLAWKCNSWWCRLKKFIKKQLFIRNLTQFIISSCINSNRIYNKRCCTLNLIFLLENSFYFSQIYDKVIETILLNFYELMFFYYFNICISINAQISIWLRVALQYMFHNFSKCTKNCNYWFQNMWKIKSTPFYVALKISSFYF